MTIPSPQTKLSIQSNAVTVALFARSVINAHVNLTDETGKWRLTVPMEHFPYLRADEPVYASVTLTRVAVEVEEAPAIITPKLIIPGRTN